MSEKVTPIAVEVQQPWPGMVQVEVGACRQSLTADEAVALAEQLRAAAARVTVANIAHAMRPVEAPSRRRWPFSLK